MQVLCRQPPNRTLCCFGKKGNKCHQKNHFAKCCTKKMREIEEDIDSDSVESTSDDKFYTGSVTVTENELETVADYEEPLKIDA